MKNKMQLKVSKTIILSICCILFVFITACSSENKEEIIDHNDNNISVEELSMTEDSDVQRLKSFYDEFVERGSYDNLKDLVQKYNLYYDYRNDGIGYYNYKIATTEEEANVISNEDLDKGDLHVLITFYSLEKYKIKKLEFVNNTDD